MTTFTLKKYQELSSTEKPSDKEEQTHLPKEEDEKTVTIKIEGSIAEIVANSLNKLLKNKDAQLIETEEQDTPTSVKAITTEDINSDPVNCYRSIQDTDILYIASKGFKTATEDWFLYNVGVRGIKTFYTQEALISYLEQKVSS